MIAHPGNGVPSCHIFTSEFVVGPGHCYTSSKCPAPNALRVTYIEIVDQCPGIPSSNLLFRHLKSYAFTVHTLRWWVRIPVKASARTDTAHHLLVPAHWIAMNVQMTTAISTLTMAIFFQNSSLLVSMSDPQEEAKATKNQHHSRSRVCHGQPE